MALWGMMARNDEIISPLASPYFYSLPSFHGLQFHPQKRTISLEAAHTRREEYRRTVEETRQSAVWPTSVGRFPHFVYL